MSISHHHRLIFVHVPKNAGTSVLEALELDLSYHRTASNQAQRTPELWRRYFTFGIVRNPWDRVVSCYEYARMPRSYWHTVDGDSRGGHHPDHHLLRELTFSQTMAILKRTPLLLQHPGWREQHPYLCSGGDVLVDRIFRYETINSDFQGTFGIALPKVNQSPRRPCTEYYDSESIDIVAREYATDIAQFGYTFGG